jgi:hypothetical protein
LGYRTFSDRAAVILHKVIALLDSLPALRDNARTALDPVLMNLLSACHLDELYKPHVSLARL